MTMRGNTVSLKCIDRRFINVLLLGAVTFFCLSFVRAYAEPPSAVSLFEGFDCSKCLQGVDQCSELKTRKDFTVADVWGTKFEQYEREGMCVDTVHGDFCEPPYHDFILYSFSKVRFLRDDLKLAPGNRFSTHLTREAYSSEEWNTKHWEGIKLRPGARYRVLLLNKRIFSEYPNIVLACEIDH